MVPRARRPDAGSVLTPREEEALELIAEGLTNAEIADRLDISVHAVKFHAASIFRKLGVSNRTEAAVTYLRAEGEQPRSDGGPAPGGGQEVADDAQGQLSRTADAGASPSPARLSAQPLIDLPVDRPRPRWLSGNVRRESACLVSADSATPDVLGARPYAVALAGLAAVLARHTQLAPLPVGIVDAEGVVRPLHVRLDDDPPFSVLAQRVERGLAGADVPANEDVRQVLFAHEAPGDVLPRDTPFDLALVTAERPEGLQTTLVVSADLFEQETARRLLSHVSTIIETATRDPGTPLSDLPLLSEAESRLLVSTWNDTGAPYPDRCLHELISEQAARTPEAIAVQAEDGSLTYAELEQRSSLLAAHLRTLGVSTDMLVGVSFRRRRELLVALLGILKAGGAYVPLDPAFPVERLELMLEDSACRVVVTEQALTGRLPFEDRTLVLVDRDWPEIERAPEGPLPPEKHSAGQLAYCIYTSGSTGRPKGVEISHRALVNLLFSARERPGLVPSDVLLAVTTLSFDIAGLELYLPLLCGATVWLCPAQVARDPRALAELIERSGATVLQATPTTWRMLCDSGWPGRKGLTCLCGGEALPQALADTLLERGLELWNMYGPTETTIWSTCARLGAGEAVTLGRPLANSRLYVLDERRRLQPIGVPGELYIGGDGLARGYRNRPDLTEERFVADPFREGERIYATGDLVRYRSDGNIEFLGRLDHQVKIRGFRVELGEVETVLARNPGVAACVCVACEDTPGDARLVAYVTAKGEPPAAGELRSYLAQRLPAYMVPSAFVHLPSFPTTPNGKIDRKALPAPSRDRDESAAGYRAAEGPLEQALVSVWEEVLGIRPIGVDDDFFDLGVTSVIAARLFARIEDAFGGDLPLAPVFQAPTIAKLAQLLEHRREERRWTSLVPIRPQGSKPPIFCVHGGAGTVLHLQPLASRLGPDQPFYGLQTRGLYGDAPPLLRIEDMAAHYLTEVREVAPEGPYYLAGYCFGAIVAFEMAQRLIGEGEDVPVLVMLNGPSPSYIQTHGPARQLNRRNERRVPPVRLTRSQRLARLVREPRRLGTYVAWRAKRTRQIAETVQFRYRVSRGRPLPERFRDDCFILINARAERAYAPEPYPGKLVCFHGAGLYVDPELGWSGLAAERIESFEVPGVHADNRTMMKEPHVSYIAERIERCLAQARGEVDRFPSVADTASL